MHHRRRIAATIVAVVVTTVSISTIEPQAGAAAVQHPSSSTTSRDGPLGGTRDLGQSRGIKVGLPTGVRVTTDASGYTVYANPVCTGAKSCNSWFKIPSVGVDMKEVSTTGGYRMSWPSSWAEGTSRTDGTIVTYGRDWLGFAYYGTGANVASLGTITRPHRQRPLTVRLAGQDDDARTATVTGTATPYAEIRRGSAVVATANAAGTWSATIRNLPVGTSTLAFTQYLNGTYVDSATVSVTIALRNLLTGVAGSRIDLAPGAATEVPGTVRTTAQVTVPFTNASVTFTAPAGTTFATGQSTIRGQYRTSSSAPWTDFRSDNLVDGTFSDGDRTARYTWRPANTDWALAAGSEIRFPIATRNPGTSESDGTMTMRVDGTTATGLLATSTTTPVHLETAELDEVTLTGPDTVAPGVDNEFTGTATPDASFEVVDATGAVIVPGGPFRVAPDGTWRFTHRVPLGATSFSFAIRQSAFGKEATSGVFTLQADTLRSGSSDTASMIPGVVNTFRGRGIPGADFRVRNPWGTEIVSGGPFRVADDGTWEFDRLISKTAKDFRFVIEQVRDGRTVTSAVFIVPAA